jgi:uncharacterized protein YaaN involved in tellurite resistance|tara:strand:- start:576 stop:1112 length:537 start_codon:yes stop_codon:yes gene_type:complete
MTEETKEAQESQEVESDVAGDDKPKFTFSDTDYADTVAESKKYRQRAQKAEQKLDKLQKRVETERQKQMADNDEWRELAEERAQKIAELEPIVERAQAAENLMRNELLSDFSDEDRETFKELPTPALRKVHGKILKPKPAKTDSSVAGASSLPSKKMSNMTKEEKRDNWSGVLASYIK